MPDYKVLEVVRVDDWSGQYGPMKGYQLRVEGPDGELEVDHNRKPDSNPPQTGEVIQGHLEDGKYRKKLKKDQQQSTSTDGRKGRQRDSDLDHRIARQVAFKGAVELMAASPPVHGEDETKAPSLYNETVIARIASLVEALLPIIEGPDSLPKQTQQLAQALSTPPTERSKPDTGAFGPDNGAIPTPTKETLTAAFKEYEAREGPEAQKKVQLKLASLGIASTEEMTDEDARKVMEFLTNG